MKKYILVVGLLCAFSFAAVAASKTPISSQSNQINGGSICDAVAGNLVSNCGFELSTPCAVGDPGCPDSFPPFWNPSGDFSYFGVTTDTGFVHSGANGVFAGQLSTLGFITQTLPTTAGASYTLTFWLVSGPPPNHFVVSWDGSVVYELVNAPPAPFMAITVPNLVASVDGTDLSFGFYQPPSFWGFDDVSVTAD